MDVTTRWLQQGKLAEIDRIVNELPVEKQAIFQKEWEQVYRGLRKQIRRRKVICGLVLLVAYPLLVLVLETIFHRPVFPSLWMATLVFLISLGMALSDWEKEQDRMIKEKREIAVRLYQEEFDGK